MYKEEDFTDWSDEEPKSTSWEIPPEFLCWFLVGCVTGYLIGGGMG